MGGAESSEGQAGGAVLPADLLQGLDRPTAAQICALRKRHGLSQEELGRLMGYTRRDRVSEFERGLNELPIERWALALLATGEHPSHRLVSR